MLAKFQGDTFYLPHNLDFRGRAYPLPPHLNRIGDDLTHGLLLFGKAKPLGERGLRWLKIRMSSLYGYDKATFEERVEFVHKHLDDIFNSAVNPLNVSLVPLTQALGLRDHSFASGT
jgi:DNA-directed RNA polymerase